METLPSALIAILAKYTTVEALGISGSTKFSELGLDDLDLPMVFLDVEDAFDVQIEFDDGIEDVTTVASLTAFVATRIAAKASAPRRTPVPRPARGWMSA